MNFIYLHYTCNINLYCRHKKWQILYTFARNVQYLLPFANPYSVTNKNNCVINDTLSYKFYIVKFVVFLISLCD